ncbi:NAD-dependent epimerase/dehydratase family protein [Streptomyces flaveolus]|uniref:NAD-dependent epimerase/dehydratase family protein n=1 Tax=Streptomyces flaveolus TaxID=67297 RepID=UPI00344596E3
MGCQAGQPVGDAALPQRLCQRVGERRGLGQVASLRPAGRETTEKDEPDTAGIAAFRIAGERACLRLAARDVRASVVRLAPTVHGPQDHGFIPMLIATARKTGVSAYVGDGTNRWPAVHRLDAAVLFRLALEKAPAGSVLPGAAESGVTLKSIAEKIARGLDLPTLSLTPANAARHFVSPFMATAYGFDGPVSSAHTQELLGWSPTLRPVIAERGQPRGTGLGTLPLGRLRGVP